MKKSYAAALILLLLLLAFLGWRGYFSHHHQSDIRPAPVIPASPRTSSPAPAQMPATPPAPVAKKPVAPKALPKPKTMPAPASAPTPPAVELHKELIPKDITIVRYYYGQDIAPPGTTFGFDINGSGFTKEFEKMIAIDPGAADLKVKKLTLVTANQIHGEMEVGPTAATGFIFPKVLIQKLPVFSPPEPFAVVRPGEVLTIMFTEMDRSGRAGKFQVVTNMTEDMAKQFHIEASTGGIRISDLTPQLPFYIGGVLQIGEVPQGEYDLTMFLGQKQIYQRKGLVRVVRPNLGRSGLAQKITATEPFHRPGDSIQFYMHGTGYSPDDAKALTVKIEPFDMGSATFTFVNPSQIQLSMQIPAQAPVGSYSVKVLSGPTVLRDEKDVFQIIPAEWVAGVQVTPPVGPGRKSVLKIIGRDLDADFAKSLRIETDESGIHFGGFALQDPTLITAEIAVDAGVAPGDYWLHLSRDRKPIKPQFGSLIKITEH